MHDVLTLSTYRNDHNYSINEEFVFDTFHALEKAFGERWGDVFVDNYDLHYIINWNQVRTWLLRDEDQYVKRCLISGSLGGFLLGALLELMYGEHTIRQVIIVFGMLTFWGFVITIPFLVFHCNKKARAVSEVYRCVNCNLSSLVPADILDAYHKNYDKFKKGYAPFEPKGMYRFLVDDFKESDPSGSKSH